jgi:hypothetical protein
MSTDQLVRQARAAARELRSEGAPVLPLAEAFYLDAQTARLFESLVALGILKPGDVPGVGAETTHAAAA